MYDITGTIEGEGRVYLRPFWWRYTGNDLAKGLESLRHARPYILPQLAKMLACDLNQLLWWMHSGQPFTEGSARFVMRVVALCGSLMVQCGDWTCTECLAPLCHRLLKRPFSALPGLRATLVELLRFNARCIAEYRESPVCSLRSRSDARA